MKILLIDDCLDNHESGRQTLVGHDVTYCATHEEAWRLLIPRLDWKKKSDLCMVLKQMGIDDYVADTRSTHESTKPEFDVVLSDLIMPAGPMSQGEDSPFVGVPTAVGWSIALDAVRYGVKYVAVVTDINHHHHPASAMLDRFNKHIFTVDAARVFMTNSIEKVGIIGSETDCSLCNGTGQRDVLNAGCHRCNKTGRSFLRWGKHWGKVLEMLITGRMDVMFK